MIVLSQPMSRNCLNYLLFTCLPLIVCISQIVCPILYQPTVDKHDKYRSPAQFHPEDKENHGGQLQTPVAFSIQIRAIQQSSGSQQQHPAKVQLRPHQGHSRPPQHRDILWKRVSFSRKPTTITSEPQALGLYQIKPVPWGKSEI